MSIRPFTGRLQNLYADSQADLAGYTGASLGNRAIIGPTGPNYVAVPTTVSPTGSYCFTGIGINWLLYGATGPLRTRSTTLLAALADPTIIVGQEIFIVSGSNALEDWRAVPLGTYSADGVTTRNGMSVQLVRAKTPFDYAVIGPPLGSGQDDSFWITQFIAKEQQRPGGPREIQFQPTDDPYLVNSQNGFDGIYVSTFAPVIIRCHPSNRFVAQFSGFLSSTPQPYIWVFPEAPSASTTHTVGTAYDGTRVITVQSLTATTPNITKGSFIGLGSTSTANPNVMSEVMKITANGSNFDIELDEDLVGNVSPGCPVWVLVSHCHDCVLDGQGAALSGTTNSTIRVLWSERIRLRNWVINTDDGEPSYGPAYDIGDRDCSAEGFRIYGESGTMYCSTESDLRCGWRDVVGCNFYFAIDGGHFGFVEHCATSMRTDVDSGTSCLQFALNQDIACQGWTLKDLQLFGATSAVRFLAADSSNYQELSFESIHCEGQNGPTWPGQAFRLDIGITLNAIRDLNIVAPYSPFAQWNGIDVAASGSGSVLNITGMTGKTNKPGTGTSVAAQYGASLISLNAPCVVSITGLQSSGIQNVVNANAAGAVCSISEYNTSTVDCPGIYTQVIAYGVGDASARIRLSRGTHTCASGTFPNSQVDIGGNGLAGEFELNDTTWNHGLWGYNISNEPLLCVRLSGKTIFNNLEAPPYGVSNSVGSFAMNEGTAVPVAFPDINAQDKISIVPTTGGSGPVLPYKVVITPGTGFSVTGTATDRNNYLYWIG